MCIHVVEFSLCMCCTWLCFMRVPAVVFDVCACVAAALCIVSCVHCVVWFSCISGYRCIRSSMYFFCY